MALDPLVVNTAMPTVDLLFALLSLAVLPVSLLAFCGKGRRRVAVVEDPEKKKRQLMKEFAELEAANQAAKEKEAKEGALKPKRAATPRRSRRSVRDLDEDVTQPDRSPPIPHSKQKRMSEDSSSRRRRRSRRSHRSGRSHRSRRSQDLEEDKTQDSTSERSSRTRKSSIAAPNLDTPYAKQEPGSQRSSRSRKKSLRDLRQRSVRQSPSAERAGSPYGAAGGESRIRKRRKPGQSECETQMSEARSSRSRRGDLAKTQGASAIGDTSSKRSRRSKVNEKSKKEQSSEKKSALQRFDSKVEGLMARRKSKKKEDSLKESKRGSVKEMKEKKKVEASERGSTKEKRGKKDADSSKKGATAAERFDKKLENLLARKKSTKKSVSSTKEKNSTRSSKNGSSKRKSSMVKAKASESKSKIESYVEKKKTERSERSRRL
ncbi:hypothetical protein L596_013952 [Steinernema carpocapsae]|uniref:Uncharacterized protein n=1 Tax=Steinernema carpocapsae TaxID=34508 RepID=A0A4V6A2J9_STECR|nr:hypothetical protein L596_013952 [Steinernema carpocapsae]